MLTDSATYTRIRDLCAASKTVGPKTPGVHNWIFDTTSVKDPERIYTHAVLALNEDDAVDELLTHYFGARNAAWHSYRLRSIQTWNEAKVRWDSRAARGKTVRNEAKVAA